MEIKYNLLPKQKKRKQDVEVIIDVFPIAEELYEELKSKGLIDRLESVQQLGPIKVTNSLRRSRYDYVMLQLYFHQIIRKNIQKRLRLTFSNRLKKDGFPSDACFDDENDLNEVTLGDAIQLLTIAYNIGHFYNTFVASRAMVMLADKERNFHDLIVNCFTDKRFKLLANTLLCRHDYKRIHLLNSLLVLEKCDEHKQSVVIARELLYAYLNSDDLPETSGLRYLFEVFSKVRTVAFVTYDLLVAGIPFSLDIENEKSILAFFDEYLANYNDNSYAENLIEALTKLLSDAVYDNPSRTIGMTQISKRMVKALCREDPWTDYYSDYWASADSIFNKKYGQKKDYDSKFLKLTFPKESIVLAEKLFYELDRLNNTRVGFYHRYSGDFTLVVAIKKKCEEKKSVAFRIMKTVTRYMRMMNAEPCSDNYILIVKFFLQYFFGECQISIDPMGSEKKCVITTRGKYSRIVELKKLSNLGTADDQHEVDAMVEFLKTDSKNDITITVPGSTVVFNEDGQNLAEFDGIIIYPNRDSRQVVLIEAKNIDHNPGLGRKHLRRKLVKLGINNKQGDVESFGYDAFCKISI